MSLRLLLVALAGLAFVATACGSASNGYRKRVDAVQAQYRPRIDALEGRLATAITRRQPAAGARAATAASSAITQLQHAISALHPPSALRARSSRLVVAYGELVHDLDLIASALRAHAPARTNTAIAHYNDARLDESSAIAALNAD